jgi:hypothetical protein
MKGNKYADLPPENDTSYNLVKEGEPMAKKGFTSEAS